MRSTRLCLAAATIAATAFATTAPAFAEEEPPPGTATVTQVRPVVHATAKGVAERMLTEISQPIRVGASEVVIGATIGIAFADPAAGAACGELRPDAVVQRADTAMYQAKVAGRGRYAVFGS